MKLETMSKNIVNTMITLAKNEMLGRLLVNDVDNPYDLNLPKPDWTKLIKPDSSIAKIFPYPFDPDAKRDDGTFIRIYYNDGEFNENEVIAESQIHIDIICSKRLWLINNGRESIIRPYDIAGRVIDLVGKRSIATTTKLKFEGYSHLYINTQFDCVRLYANYMSVESK
ncbi:hypothetical protein JDW21_19645 [Bacillus subtilis]|uniref:hypothetical protein n=1 Tax=Bacillus subtilis TaxID=1423 RepID=UPI002ED539F7